MQSVQAESSILIDSNAYLYRFFYGSEPRYCQEGNPTHVTYAFMSFARRLISQHKPQRMIFVFDAPGENFRHALYPEYKSHRDPMPEELASQIESTKKALNLLGVPVLQHPDVEADDSIASLAQLISDHNEFVYIYSLDKDLMQLVNSNIFMVDDRRGILIDEDYVRNKYNISPHRVVELLALTGDDADNIPGVDGIGHVTAAKLINQWGDIESIIANAHWVKGVVGNKLRKGEEALRMSLSLTGLRRDLFDLSILSKLRFLPEDKLGIYRFCQEMGFDA